MKKHRTDVDCQPDESADNSESILENGGQSDQTCPKCAEYLAGWQRAQADYANLKKDLDRVKQEYTVYANENLLHELLPAIDQFEIALSYLPDTSGLSEQDKKKMDSWLVGIKAVKLYWEQIFETIGLRSVDTEGTFNPEKHSAVGQDEQTDKPHEAILKVIQPGWELNGKVLRPAQVIVNQLKIKN